MNNFTEESYAAFQEAALDKYDFQTCARADGSLYGTGGQCRQGTPTTKPEKGSKTKASSGGGGGSASSSSGGGGSTKALQKEAKSLDKVAKAADKKAEAADKKWRKGGMKDKALQKEVRSLDKEAKAANRAAEKADKAYQKSAKTDAKTEQAARKQLSKDMKLKAGQKLTPAQQKERSDKISAEVERRKAQKGPKRPEMTSKRAAEVKAQFDLKRQRAAGGQDGPKATASQRQAAMKNLRREANTLENKRDKNGKLSAVDEAKLKRVKASQREYEIEGKQRMRRQTK